MNVHLTLVSHTNVGKTSLMRTLLRRSQKIELPVVPEEDDR